MVTSVCIAAAPSSEVPHAQAVVDCTAAKTSPLLRAFVSATMALEGREVVGVVFMLCYLYPAWT